ncbi:MAG: CaiB/BaiF CoA-transferase family protein [Bradyrhizobium sp.]|jgi:crotonobetainyl-CoA:carnitine CoA-transferase CaiB-like acyl-CoA transferase|uniref:CaiB/BaiF CoA transferase family protein n=1 Tax=Bradyrhizobium sp. TaxID=376 RepID=UPI00271AA3D1|nr:CaiB/BaiF CoA-transferase family protein [Bradyrhizobium sp.]MDO8396511.1 CaiB/BaiF CoA-transferase family protein [Bradyrhizobium sp.]
MAGPLVGYRVLDLSRILAGPWLGQLLSDLGAEVWKIERPGTGDDTRQWGPPFLKDGESNDTTESAYFLSANRGKHSICVDIATNEGSAIVRALAQQADIVIENYKVGDMTRYGLDYESLRKLKPDIVYCSITGYGQTGPMKDVAGYDMAIQATGGLMSITGESDDMPGGGPQKVGVPIVDILTGMYSATGVISALLHRERTGEGQHIDMALLDVQVSVLANQNMNYLTTGTPPKRYGNAHPNIVPYQVFKTRDGSFVLAVGNDQQFRNFCAASGLTELATDVRFLTNTDRLYNRDQLIPLMDVHLAKQTTRHWISMLEPVGVPCAPINRLDQVFAHPQVIHRELQINLPHSSGAVAPLVGNPIKFSRTKIEYSKSPPLRGEDTVHILKTVLKFDEARIQRLNDRRIVDTGTHPRHSSPGRPD